MLLRKQLQTQTHLIYYTNFFHEKLKIGLNQESAPPPLSLFTMSEVQKHGFVWEHELKRNVYGATEEELARNLYTAKIDLPAEWNHKDGVDVSIKTTGSQNVVCMADCLRIYDEVSSGKPLHLTVVTYKQNDATHTKTITNIVEIDLTSSVTELFGTLTRAELEELDRAVKAVPKGSSPSKEMKDSLQSLQASLQKKSGAIYMNIKCDSKSQRRLQCSFNHFQTFLKEHPSRIIAQSTSAEFRGGRLTETISSGRRTLKSKKDTPLS